MNRCKNLSISILSVLLCGILAGCGTSQDALIVDELIDEIGFVTLDSEEAITKAEQAYDGLNKWNKHRVESYQELVNAREAYNSIKNVSDLIDALETITLDSENGIIEAETAYAALSIEEQHAIKNHFMLVNARNRFDSLLLVNDVEKAIASAESIDIDKIQNSEALTPYTFAKKMYMELSADEKLLVQNYDVLEKLEADIPIGWKIPVLQEDKYWEKVDIQLRQLFREHNLFIIRIDAGAPYRNYHIEPGVLVSENTYQPKGLEQEEYETLFSEMKNALYSILNQYSIDFGNGFFSRPNTDIIGLHFYNRFNHSVFGKGAELGVADYQIDLLSYYYHYLSDQYTKIDNFDAFYWTVSSVYVP